jgi:hypothetical protein
MNLAKPDTLVLILFLAAGCLCADKRVIQPQEFPKGRPFSPGLLVDGTLYVKEAAMGFEDVVSVQVYLTVGVAKLAGTARLEITVTARRR